MTYIPKIQIEDKPSCPDYRSHKGTRRDCTMSKRCAWKEQGYVQTTYSYSCSGRKKLPSEMSIFIDNLGAVRIMRKALEAIANYKFTSGDDACAMQDIALDTLFEVDQLRTKEDSDE